MILMGSSFTKTMIGLMGAGIILTLLVPSGLARTVIFVAIAQGLIQALNVDTRSRMSSALIMAAIWRPSPPACSASPVRR